MDDELMAVVERAVAKASEQPEALIRRQAMGSIANHVGEVVRNQLWGKLPADETNRDARVDLVAAQMSEVARILLNREFGQPSAGVRGRTVD